MASILSVQIRDRKSNLRTIRRNGFLPGVVYGKNIKSQPIQIEKKEFLKLIRQKGRYAVVQLKINDESTMDAIIHEIQTDPVEQEIIHVDFQQIKKGEKINTVLRILPIGIPQGVKEGGILQQQLEHVHVFCVPDLTATPLEVNIEELQMGDHLKVGDLALPSEIELKDSPHDIILTITTPQLDPIDQATAEQDPKAPDIVHAVDGPGIDAAK